MSIPLGNKIKVLREKHNLSQTSLAELVSLSPQYISLIERGDRKASDETLAKISEYFKINKEELIKLREEGLNYPKMEPIGQTTLPVYIQEVVDILLKIEEEDCKQIVNDLLKGITDRFYNLLKMYSHREVKQEVLKIRNKWVNFNTSNFEQENVNVQGCIQLDNPIYFSLNQMNNVIHLTLLPSDFSQVKMFEEWLDRYQVSFSKEETIPHMTSRQKVYIFVWFSPFLSSFDKYNYLCSEGIMLNDVECNDVQLNWLIQAKNLSEEDNQEHVS